MNTADLAAFRIWSTAFLANARQLDQPAIGVEWYQMGVTALDAAAWANLGFLPGEAQPLIADGITPALYSQVNGLGNDA